MAAAKTTARLFGVVCLASLGLCGLASPAMAKDYTYTYDALGRVVTVTRSDGLVTTYTYDAAGNRTGQTITGPPGVFNPNAGKAIVVLPLGGLPVIFVNRAS